LVADDIENRTESGKKRSQAVRGAAATLACYLKTGIELLFVEDPQTYPAEQFDPSRIHAWHSKHWASLEEMSRQVQVPVRCTIKSGSPAEQILKVLQSRPSPELAVVGTQGRKGLKRLLIGSVAEEVIRHSKRPVMVVGPEAQRKDLTSMGLKKFRILVATDLGRHSRAAERYALSLAMRAGASVVLYHCLADTIRLIMQNSAISGMLPFNFDEILRDIREDAVLSLKHKVRFFEKQGVPCEYALENKSITSECAVFQEGHRGYAFIVMGTHGRNALLNAFFGSTARETILNSSIPVITVHSGK